MSDTEKKPTGYWNYENCYNAAKECKTNKEFFEKYPSVYQISWRKGWLKDYIWLKKVRKQNGYWNNYDNCYNAAMECKTISEFIEKYCQAYYYAKNNNWLDNYTWIDHIKKSNGYWNYERCYNAALECKSRVDFEKRYGSAYAVARKNGWLDDYTWFERKSNFVEDKIHSVYCYFFNEQHYVYVGRTNDITLRDWSHKHKVCPVKKFADKHNVSVPEITILESGLTLNESLIYEGLYVEQYKADGWNIINRAKTGLGSGSIGAVHKKWTKNKCYNAALECKTRSNFKKRYCSAYNVARKNGWLDDYTWFVDGNKLTCEQKGKPKRVLQYTLEGEFVKEWKSSCEIHRVLGFSHSHISDCCKNNKTGNGYIWKYAA